MSENARFAMSIMALAAATVLAALRIISGGEWLAFVAGALMVNPASLKKAVAPALLLTMLPGCTEGFWFRPLWGTFAGTSTTYVKMNSTTKPAACASPYGCLYYSSVDNLLHEVDASGNEYASGTAWRARQYAGTPGGVATGDVWHDTTSGLLMWRSASGSVTLGNTGGMVTADTTQTITGDKTFTGAVTLPAATLVYARHSAGGTGTLGAATVYLTAPGQAASSTERNLTVVTRATTSRKLYCYLGTGPGGSDTVVFTVRENASDTTLTCTITASATTCSDTTHTFASVAGDLLSIKAVSSATTAAAATCAFEEGN